ncbi:putative bifunctional diguanylate cyclase/phosphodiesterase [Mycolicibacterium mengxianglii]|uniref:putative bifunctional diguanylate cyclase/phosphodiesterase n=1 Tax=Mycolicibacterium mengxianglii TaxID=2736649 RepID=UPI001E60000E|nr:bifunctional diguanylate cyclase/phosphodiesterase [Mycolicibacterium mengxianglii]
MGRAEVLWRQVRNARRWPGIATPRLMARTGAACYLFGGLLVLLLVALEPSNFRVLTAIYLEAGVSITVGVATFLVGPRLRSWQFQLLVVSAIALITVAVSEAGVPATAVSLATLYAFVAFAAFFLSWPQSVAYLTLAVVCCTAVLHTVMAVSRWSALIVCSSTVVMGCVIALLGQLMVGAERDPATGLPNRRGFDRLLAREIDRAQSGGLSPVVLLLRLELFNDIDRSLGHEAGNQLLRSTLKSWRQELSSEHVLTRVGTDEFAVLLLRATEHDGVALSHRLRAVTSTDFSAGVTGWQLGEAAAAVSARSDVALRRAKLAGRNRTVLESAGLPTLARELAEAIADGAVGVLYQPIVSLADGNQIVGVEALARWTSPTRPDLSIAEVIAMAENSNLIATLDRFVLRRACLDLGWMCEQRNGLPLTLTVNVSGLDLIESNYAATVSETLTDTGWPAGKLVLEVTESVVDVDTPSALATLRELRTHGVRVAIDDFGTGYSTLSRLQNLPIDLLKLDASFTTATSLDSGSAPPPLLQAIAALARALDLPVVIEGVETQLQANAMQDVGFTMAQGYFFGRPQTRELIVDQLTVA